MAQVERPAPAHGKPTEAGPHQRVALDVLPAAGVVVEDAGEGEVGRRHPEVEGEPAADRLEAELVEPVPEVDGGPVRVAAGCVVPESEVAEVEVRDRARRGQRGVGRASMQRVGDAGIYHEALPLAALLVDRECAHEGASPSPEGDQAVRVEQPYEPEHQRRRLGEGGVGVGDDRLDRLALQLADGLRDVLVGLVHEGQGLGADHVGNVLQLHTFPADAQLV